MAAHNTPPGPSFARLWRRWQRQRLRPGAVIED
jgi:hypothetical protein